MLSILLGLGFSWGLIGAIQVNDRIAKSNPSTINVFLRKHRPDNVSMSDFKWSVLKQFYIKYSWKGAFVSSIKELEVIHNEDKLILL